MPVPVHVFNIPANAAHLVDVAGQRFDASLYKVANGEVAAYVEIDKNATDAQLGAEQMSTRIQAAAPHGMVAYYVIRRR